MLVDLRISDFAIIKRFHLSLPPGLTTLSGETGAGKSIIINAINLLLGGRASSDLIRSGCSEAGVEARFVFPMESTIAEAVSHMGFDFDGELLIQRTISREGRNKIFINGSMATVQMLSRLGAHIISVSGQHEHQVLLRAENHLLLLDDFGGLSRKRDLLAERFAEYRDLSGRIERIAAGLAASAERRELSEFQNREIEGACIIRGEDEELARERTRLRHAEDLSRVVSESYHCLYERHESVCASLSACSRNVRKATGMDSRLEPVAETLSELEMKVEDVSFVLRDLTHSIQMDPQRLEEVEERLEHLNRLKRKYGPTLEEVLAFRDRIASNMEDMEEERGRLEELRGRGAEMEQELLARALELSRARRDAAGQLESAAERELHQLHMGATTFRVRFDSPGDHEDEPEGFERVRPEGIDRVEFMIAPNVGEEPKPLSKIASGGELSRITLALKTILARTASVESLVFDEVDSGISGAAAEVVGEKLLSLAAFHQIVCITHLPQIASQGSTHFLVSKEVVDGRTETRVSRLGRRERVMEIARLLGGRRIQASAIAHAEEMLRGSDGGSSPPAS